MSTTLLVPSEVFGPVSGWDFRYLPTDQHGLVVHRAAKDVFAYNTFQFLDGKFRPFIIDPVKQVRDLDVEAVFDAGADIRAVEIDMRRGDNPRTNVVSVYPATITGTAVYDVLFYTDWLFKFALRFMTRLIFLDQPFETVGNNDMIVTLTPNQDGNYFAAPTRGRAGFTALKNEMMLFKLRNKDKLADWRANFAKYDGSQEFKAQLVFDKVEVTSTHGQILHLKDPRPHVRVGTLEGAESLPGDHPAHVLRDFVEAHYPRLREAFPVYRRLETVFKLCTLNCLVAGVAGDQASPMMTLTEAGTHVESVYLKGGIKLVPQIVAAPAPVVATPAVDPAAQAREKARRSECRTFFNQQGFICSFAPKLTIEDCLDTALNQYHECLKLEEVENKK